LTSITWFDSGPVGLICEPWATGYGMSQIQEVKLISPGKYFCRHVPVECFYKQLRVGE